jgi:hypothetical protein
MMCIINSEWCWNRCRASLGFGSIVLGGARILPADLRVDLHALEHQLIPGRSFHNRHMTSARKVNGDWATFR